MSSINNLKTVWVRQGLTKLRLQAKSALQQKVPPLLGTKTHKMQTNRNQGKLEHSYLWKDIIIKHY